MTARPQLSPGLRLSGRYHLRTPLGRGGAGTVWRADDVVLDRSVAGQLLHPELERDTSAVTRFRREATAAAALTHPNAVIVYDIGEDAGRIFLVMELVDGITLSDLLLHGAMPPEDVAALGGAVARALGAAHDRGLVHRDVKPGNVLITREGVAKVADFGIATALGDAQSRLTTPGMVVGTSTYLAPEQLEGAAVDGRADVYALGLVLHEALSGVATFSGGTAVEVATRRLAGDVPAVGDRVDGVPEDLDLIVQRATRREAEHRWEDGHTLAGALAALTPYNATARLAALIEQRIGPPPEDEPLEDEPLENAGAPVAAVPHAASSRTAGGQTNATARVGPLTGDPGSSRPTGAEQPPAADTDETAAAGIAPTSAMGAVGTPGLHGPRTEQTGTLPEVADQEPAQAPPRRSGGRIVRWALLGLLVLALLGLAVVGMVDDQTTLDADPEIATDDPPEAIEIVDAAAFDPHGSGEHPEDVPNAFDGDPETRWQTQRYNSAPLGNLKPGVGIYFDLGEPSAVRELALATRPSGAEMVVYAGEQPPSDDDDFDPETWGEEVARVDSAAAEEVLELDDAEGRIWLVWLTSLPADDGGFRTSLNEVELRG